MIRHPIISATGLLIGLSMAIDLGAAPPEGKGKPEKVNSHHRQTKSGHGKRSQNQSTREFHGHLPPLTISYDNIRRLAVDYRYTGYRALPPGIQKNLTRGKPLPPGIAKQVVSEPLLQQLPVYPGYEWGVYGSDLILVEIATGIIQQVLLDIFR